MFDVFYEEGDSVLKMMFIGLYCWFVGRLGCVVGLKCFLDYIK